MGTVTTAELSQFKHHLRHPLIAAQTAAPEKRWESGLSVGFQDAEKIDKRIPGNLLSVTNCNRREAQNLYRSCREL